MVRKDHNSSLMKFLKIRLSNQNSSQLTWRNKILPGFRSEICTLWLLCQSIEHILGYASVLSIAVKIISALRIKILRDIGSTGIIVISVN